MCIAFFGSPEFVLPILSYLHKAFGVALVVTQPDKPVGRKQILTPTPVAQFAQKNSIEIYKDLSMFRKIDKLDVAIVAAYGLIIPKEILEIPKFGFINIHYSLLPKYRGASPVQTAIVNGEKVTGTTIMRMDQELDHGEIIAQKEVIIDENDTSDILLNKLNEASLPLLDKALRTIEITGQLPPMTEQENNKATFTRRLTKEDGFIEFNSLKNAITSGLESNKVHNFIRGYFPWPGVWTTLPNGKRLKLIKSRIARHPELVSGSKKMLNQVQHDTLELLEVQLEGKQKTTDLNFLKEFLQ